MTWSAIVLTCRDNDEANTFQKQLELRQQKGRISQDVVLLALPDPKARVGSGGATLNALLVVTEHISARAGFTVVNGDVLQDAKILIVHVGRSFALDPCCRAFVQLPLTSTDDSFSNPVCNLDVLLATLTKLAKDNPPGLWVCSTDMFIDIPTVFDTRGCDVCSVSVPASIDYAAKHGVFKLGPQNELCDVIYQGTHDQLEKCALPSGQVPLVAGLQYFSVMVTETLLPLHTIPPLDACTYLGLDSGAQPIQVSLFFDLLLPMCTEVSEDSFVNGPRSGMYGKSGTVGEYNTWTMQSARQLLWKHLHFAKAKVVVCEGGRHSYMSEEASTHLGHLLNPLARSLPSFKFNNRQHSFIHENAHCAASSVLINSRLTDGVHVGERCALSHSYLHTPVRVGDDSLVNGVWTLGLEKFSGVILPDKLLLQTFHIRLPGLNISKHLPVLTTLGMDDSLQLPLNSATSSYCNQEWSDFLLRTGITEFDLWPPNTPSNEQRLLTAKLFPVAHPKDSLIWSHTLWLCGAINIPGQLHKWRECWRLSMTDILGHVDVGVEMGWRETQFYWTAEQVIRDTILNRRHTGLNPIYQSAVVDGKAEQMLTLLDKVAGECSDAGVAARVLANIADVLGAMATNNGGLRSGPALNESWKPAFDLLEASELNAGMAALALERQEWMRTPRQLIRAARHYQGAAQILIRHAVMSARQFIKTTPTEAPPVNSWVTIECPARVDISGGWSDTPPITYEHGGMVVNAAISLDGKRPIGAKARRIDTLELIFHIGRNTENVMKLDSLSQLADYTSPQAPGALLKAAFICADVVHFPSHTSLQEQLRRHGGGFELVTWSELPHGSGLGTSSILAGAIMAALWLVSGRQFDISALNHAVLHLEQMVTTGGGWQDQVGGLTPGIKCGHSQASLPLRVEIRPITISEQTIRAFSDRLVLIYTGKTRLARDLLQNVVRNWYARDPAILQTQVDLCETAKQCVKAFEKGSLQEVGACMDAYWQQKKHMAPGCEPRAVTYLMTSLREHAHGMALAGAGGGGFLYVLFKEPTTADQVHELLRNVEGINLENMSVHQASVDPVGMLVTCDTRGLITIPTEAANTTEL